MIDIRYHIYSLAAIFFALAVGIVIGTSVAKRTPAAGSVNRTIQRYEQSMRVLKAEIEKTSREAAASSDIARGSEEYCRQVLPIVAKNRLAWRNVAIVRTGDYDDLSGSIKRALELAGAQVTSVTDISRKFDFDDDNQVAETLTSCGVTPPADAKQARDKLFSLLTDTLYAGTYSGLLSKLEEAGVAKFTGEYGKYNKLIVLVGGSASEEASTAETIDARLIAQLEKPNVVVVGCESSTAACSYVPAWHKTGIASVDNADSAIGQVAMLCALNGEQANFGVKETADRLTPQSLETK